MVKKDNVIKWLITILLVYLPVLDILRTTAFKNIELFGIALIEFGNILLIGIAFLLTLTKCSKKQLCFVFGYLLILALYLYLHYKNIILFDKSIFPRANQNFITEMFYIGRVYILPLALLFVLLKNKSIFNKEFYFKIVKIVILFISFSIIFLNITKLSYISYSLNHNHILYNMFDYFLYSGDYKLISSRGWFDSANELSAVLLMLFPINIYLVFKERCKINYVLFISQFLAMILLGTRTAAFGACLLSFFFLLLYLFFVYLKKEKLYDNVLKFFIISVLICTSYMTISPFMFGRMYDSDFDFSVQNKKAYDNIKKTSKKSFSKMFVKYKDEYLINEELLKMYPLKNDIEFWMKMAKRDRVLNSNNRKMKIDIISRVMERNNNSSDKYFGMGYTLNFMDLERDYYYQFYLFGIFGLIVLIVPYFIILLFYFSRFLCNFKKEFNFLNTISFISPFLGLVMAYLSGHVFGWVSPMLYLVMCFGLLSVVINLDSLKAVSKNVKKK